MSRRLSTKRREPQTHWLLLSLVMLTLLSSLFVSGVIDGQVGEKAQTPESRQTTGAVPRAIRDGGPIVDPSRPEQPGIRIPDRHVVLTFDDGPTPWTAEILDVLRARGVPATFFVVGARAADRPDLLRRMQAEGHEVGVHTLTHVNLANVSGVRLRAELSQTQLASAAATGHTTNLLRPPYSSQVDSVRPSEWQAVERTQNYRVVYADLDPQDWAKPGAAKIAQAGVPRNGEGAVVMLHDGGGDRAQTVAAVDLLITELQHRGYTFDTVSSAIQAPSSWHSASLTQRVQGTLVSGFVQASGLLVSLVKLAFITLAVLATIRTIALLVMARQHRRQHRRRYRRRHALAAISPSFLPAVSVVVPAYNEELGIGRTIRSLAASDYPDLDIVVVDDGSRDATSEVVRQLGLPNVRLIRQANAGKPAALSTGIRAACHGILVLVDGDTVFEPDTMRALVAPLARAEVGAVSGNTKVGNRRGHLGRWQHIEYVTGFNLDRRMFDILECMPTVPGAIGAFRRAALVDAGGLSDDTLAEDTDLTMAISRAGWRVVYTPDARAWTEAPASLGQLWRQRYRWCYGTMQAMWKHRKSVTEAGASGKLGRRGLPYLVTFQVLLPLLAPAIDIATLYALFFAWSPQILVVGLAFLAMQVLTAAYAFRLEGESLRPLWALPLQQFVYRQLMYLVVIQSVSSALYGLRLRWRTIRRTGDMEVVPVEAGV